MKNALLIVVFCFPLLGTLPPFNHDEVMNIQLTCFTPRLANDDVAREIKKNSEPSKPPFYGYPKVSASLSPEYSEQMLIDRKKETCWAYRGVKGFVVFYQSGKFDVLNGLWASKQLYLANNRVKEIRIRGYAMIDRDCLSSIREIIGGPYIFLDQRCVLPDVMTPLSFHCENNPKLANFQGKDGMPAVMPCLNYTIYYYYRIDIESVYPGSMYDDTCISLIGSRQLALFPDENYNTDIRVTNRFH